MFVPRIAALR